MIDFMFFNDEAYCFRNDLIIETAPTNAAVFIDDSYAGFSAMIPSHIGSISEQLVDLGFDHLK